MFERFTDRARRAVVLAQEESRGFSHGYIGTEHLLLGLIAEGEGLASQVLHDLGLSLEQTRTEVEERIGRGSEQPTGHIPFTPRAKKVLELSLREALQLNHKYIGTEHLLLGLVREGEGVAALILLARIEGGIEEVRDKTLEKMSSFGSIPEEAVESIKQRAASAIVAEAARSEGGDEIVQRLEAIEARLSAIERLLRGREEGTG